MARWVGKLYYPSDKLVVSLVVFFNRWQDAKRARVSAIMSWAIVVSSHIMVVLGLIRMYGKAFGVEMDDKEEFITIGIAVSAALSFPYWRPWRSVSRMRQLVKGSSVWSYVAILFVFVSPPMVVVIYYLVGKLLE